MSEKERGPPVNYLDDTKANIEPITNAHCFGTEWLKEHGRAF